MKTMKNLLMPLVAILLATTLFTSCSKDDETPDYGNPVITLKADAGYTSQNVTVLYSDTLMVGLKFQSNGSDNLTNFKIGEWFGCERQHDYRPRSRVRFLHHQAVARHRIVEV